MISRRDLLAFIAAGWGGVRNDEIRGTRLHVMAVGSQAEALDILDQLKRGEPLEALAKRFWESSGTREGGYVGQVEVAALSPSLQRALRNPDLGNIANIAATPSGYVLLGVAQEPTSGAPEDATSQGMSGRAAVFDYELVTNVDGLFETDRLFDRLEKPAGFQLDLQVNCDLRAQEPRGGIQEMEAYAREAHHILGQLYSYEGEMSRAIEHFHISYSLANSLGLEQELKIMEKKLAIAYFRLAENENWIASHNSESAIFPLSPKSQFKLASGAEKATQHAIKSLAQSPGDLEQKWLLNLAQMSLGKYSDSVPKEHLIPLTHFESAMDIGRFQDVAPDLGLDVFGMAGGVIVDDFDNDGFLDIVVSSWDHCAPLRYFHNNGDGTFSDRSKESGLGKQLGGINLIQTDYNNDGWLDIYILRGGWQGPVRDSLLRNNGDGTFTDVTKDAGLTTPPTANHSAVWADVDNDGLLDLFVANELLPNQLYRNNGDGTFTDVAHSAGVDRIGYGKAVVAADFDGDGYPDFYVSNYGQENFLFRNNGNGTFTDVAKQMNVGKPLFSFATWFFDYDNDGWPDLFVTSFVHSVHEVMRSYMRQPVKAETLKLYKNMGGTSFQDVTREAGLERVFMPMGANFGDIDNDGFLDFYLGTGDPSYVSLVPNVLFKNVEGKRFVDITASSRTGSLQKGHGVAIADIFNDGKPCIYENIGGATRGDKYYSALFRNPSTQGNWISVKLVGVKSNRAAIGARIKVSLNGDDGQPRHIYRHVSSGGSFGASPLVQHIGLGKAARIEAIEIFWPASKTTQTFQRVEANQFIEIREFAKNYSKLNRKQITLRRP